MTETPQSIAYQLLKDILQLEKGTLERVQQKWGSIPRGFILDLYAECLETVQGERKKKEAAKE